MSPLRSLLLESFPNVAYAGLYEGSGGRFYDPQNGRKVQPALSSQLSGRNAYDPHVTLFGSETLGRYAGEIAVGAAIGIGIGVSILTAGAATPWIVSLGLATESATGVTLTLGGTVAVEGLAGLTSGATLGGLISYGSGNGAGQVARDILYGGSIGLPTGAIFGAVELHQVKALGRYYDASGNANAVKVSSRVARNAWVNDVNVISGKLERLADRAVRLGNSSGWQAESIFQRYASALDSRLQNAGSRYIVEWQPAARVGSCGERTWSGLVGGKWVSPRGSARLDAGISDLSGTWTVTPRGAYYPEVVVGFDITTNPLKPSVVQHYKLAFGDIPIFDIGPSGLIFGT